MSNSQIRLTCTRTSQGCFAAGTLVRTPRGLFPIERLVVGDEVVSADGCLARIAVAHQATARELIKITCSDKTSVLATPWHRFFDLHGDLCHAERLRAGTIVRSHNSIAQIARVDRIMREAPTEVFNLSLERGVSFFANGLLVEAPHKTRVLAGHSLLSRAS